MRGAASNSVTGDTGRTREADEPNKLRVLVVDDNEDSATSLAAMFEILGHEARVAFDGISGVEATETFRPDVVLLDIGLPKLSGLAAARKIREQQWGRAVFLIAVTGWGDEKDRRRSTEAGFDLHLVKPVDPVALENVLARRQRQSPVREPFGTGM